MEEKKIKRGSFIEPKMIDTASSRSSRSSGRASFDSSTNGAIGGLLSNIRDGVSPFSSKTGDVDAKDAIELCQKAYWNVSIFKLTIDIMSEFANSNLHFVGQNKTANKFYEDWWQKIGGWDLGDQAYRELFRSSNLFMYKVYGDIVKIGNKPATKIPLKYIVLNPADMRCSSAASFIDGSYKKILNSFESEVLKNSTDLKNIELKKSLPQKVQDDIQKGVETSIPLSPDDLCVVFFKKQDYEPLAIPMYFPVLFDINLKLEFKKAEQLIARACEYLILLINTGDEKNGCDQDIVDSIENLFKTESVGRVLISDWTTKMQFVIPDLAKILGPEKYQAVNDDIANGLMNIFFGEAKFGDSMIKIKVFLERINEARKVFLNKFLIPEMETIGKKMGFKNIPTPVFEELDLRDEIEYKKLYNRLMELGILTADETLTAYKTHILPEPYDNIVSQKEFKKEKDSGLYEPISQNSSDSQPGSPSGVKTPKTKKTIKPAGASVYNSDKLPEVAKEASNLIESTYEYMKKKFGLARISKKNKSFAKNVAFSIMQNEKMENWRNEVEVYFNDPTKVGPIYNDVADLADQHSLNFNEASILFAIRETSQT